MSHKGLGAFYRVRLLIGSHLSVYVGICSFLYSTLLIFGVLVFCEGSQNVWL